MILALPLVLSGSMPSRPIHLQNWPPGVSVPGERQRGDPPATTQRAQFERTIRRGVLYGNPLSPSLLLVLIAVWKAALFVPVMLVIFQWCRAIYGLTAAWVTQGLILADPTFAAHIPIAALDTLAVGVIVIACFCMWRFFERETTARLVLAAITTAAAMLIKHTAVITPGVFLLMALHYWVWRPWRAGAPWPKWREKLNALGLALLAGAAAMWGLLLFDVSVPADQMPGAPRARHPSAIGEIADTALHRRWPAGTYIGCFASGFQTNRGGQRSLLFGDFSRYGRWHYFPALASLKVPIGTLLVVTLALGSLIVVRTRSGEMSIVIPLLAWLTLLVLARMNTGFRHFLPAYVFVLMWCGRAVVGWGKVGVALSFVGVAAAAAHALSFHPDYLAYANFPRRQVWMQMTDSNLDWNQSIRQIGPWLDRHPPSPGQTVYVAPRLGQAEYVGRYWLGHRVTFVDRGKPPPRDGILIISPIWVSGVYDDPGENVYQFLQTATPVNLLGHSMLVYDLDAR